MTFFCRNHVRCRMSCPFHDKGIYFTKGKAVCKACRAYAKHRKSNLTPMSFEQWLFEIFRPHPLQREKFISTYIDNHPHPTIEYFKHVLLPPKNTTREQRALKRLAPAINPRMGDLLSYALPKHSKNRKRKRK